MLQSALFENSNNIEEDTFFDFEQNANWCDEFGLLLKEHSRKSFPKIKTLSLFSGAGGLDIGFHDAGFNILSSVEIEPHFSKTLEENSGSNRYFNENTEVNCIDIKKFKPNYSHVDFIIGGPPCQSFSAAGARASGVAGTKDDRGNLFLEYVRLLRELKPKGFLFENVYRIIGANKGKDWQKIVEAFSSVGYKLFYRILDAADYGVPQHRERLIIVGVREDFIGDKWFLFPRPTHGPDSRTNIGHFSSFSALHEVTYEPAKNGLNGRYGHLLKEIPPGLNYSFFTEKMGHPNPVFAWRSKFSDFLYKADPLRPVRTIKAQGGQYTGPFHWESRAFTVNELKRLQTFPDSYSITGGRGTAIHQIGNSVPPQFARILALSILDQIFNLPLPVSLDYLSPKEELGFRKRKRELSKSYKAKAEEALKNTSVKKQSMPIVDRIIEFSVSEVFGISLQGQPQYVAKSYLEDGAWCIDIALHKSDVKPSDCKFEINITPRKEWIVPAKRISIRSFDCGLDLYTASWKILDWLLHDKKMKADLVQLCGYYQYEPSIDAKLHVHVKKSLGNAHLNKLLENVCNNTLTGKNIHAFEFSEFLNVDACNVKQYLEDLKNIGYEVRGSGTNISIDSESYLIPYAFPTLTPQSVQLNKKL